jgi:hypothetical protein
MSDMAKKALRQDRETRNIGTLQRILDQLASCHPSIRKWLLAEGYLPAEAVAGWAAADRDSALEMVLRELDLLARARRFSAMTEEEVGALDEGGLWFWALLPLPAAPIGGLRPSRRLLLEYRLEFDLDTWVRIRWEDWDDGFELSGRGRRLIDAWNRGTIRRQGGRRKDPADWWKRGDEGGNT